MTHQPFRFDCGDPVAPAEAIAVLRALGSLSEGPGCTDSRIYVDTFDWRLLGAGASLIVRDARRQGHATANPGLLQAPRKSETSP